MAKYLIEVPHETDKIACARAIKGLIEHGSHFLNQVDYGCEDGVHVAWAMAEADSKEEARYMIPSLYRSQAKIVQLSKFTLEEIDEFLDQHESHAEEH